MQLTDLQFTDGRRQEVILRLLSGVIFNTWLIASLLLLLLVLIVTISGSLLLIIESLSIFNRGLAVGVLSLCNWLLIFRLHHFCHYFSLVI